ncbi:hypothetical protein BOX15_Mlig024263g1 [Macrostomum lignano]|uniref:CBM21 domain-containing protein n=2 Tax=Macrostomum lignano TaxID=282301 RepID=A0A1I8JGE3_9PLAT|nr:hypothetical protein BOX15_Mlig024263g1 [Macrostomum lignano]
MPFNVPTAGALKEAADFIMTSTRSSPEASPVFDHHDDSWQVSSYSNYFSTSAAPLDRYTDALVAEIGAATELPVKDRHSLPRLSTLAATAAASHRTELPPPGWRRWRRRRRVTFADEVGLQLERVACRDTDFYSGSGEDSEATSLVTSVDTGSARHRRSTVCGFFSQTGGDTAASLSSFSSDPRPQIHLSMLHLRRDGSLVAIATVTSATISRVFARMTLDSWNSYRDVDASSGVKEDPAASDTTVCSIELLQQNLQQLQQQQQQLEFCLCLQRVDPAGSCESVWDNNGGRNYRLKLPVTDLCPVPE